MDAAVTREQIEMADFMWRHRLVPWRPSNR
jgi:hypothetical protein